MPNPNHTSVLAQVSPRLQRIRRKVWRRLTRYDQQIVELPSHGPPRGRVLLSYILEPLLALRTAEVETLSHDHTHFWETATIAQTFLDLGYSVTGLSWTNRGFNPGTDYDFAIDVRGNLELWAAKLPERTVRIFHSDTCHWKTNNSNQEDRQARLTERRGVTLKRHKMAEPNKGAESAHILTYLGNAYTRETFGEFDLPKARIPVSVPFTYDWPANKDFDSVRKNFLWFGSGGMVHKGLDLVLEAFAQMPDLNLTVCGPVEKEPDFVAAYEKELRHTPNIHWHGWIDTRSQEFARLCRDTLALVYPSCAEGGGSSALTCMHAGLIPILTPSASVDLNQSQHQPTGIELANDSIETICDAVQELSEKPANDLEALAHNGWRWARETHCRETFTRDYRSFAERLIAGDVVAGNPVAGNLNAS